MIVSATFAATLAAMVAAMVAADSATPAAPSYDTIVVGLGSAGATAASTLARAGRRVLALEAQSYIGGRVRSEHVIKGVAQVDADWIPEPLPNGLFDPDVLKNVSVLQQNLPITVHRSDGSKSDATLTELFNYGLQVISEGSDVPESMGQLIERKLRQYLAKKKPELLNDKELINRFLELMNQVVNTMVASESFNDVSAQTWYDNRNGHSYFAIWHRHYPPYAYFEMLLNTYNNGTGLPSLDIKLNKEVTSIQWNTSGGVVATCRTGDQYSAGDVVVTVSLGVLKERHATLFSPPLPQEKVTAIESIAMGVIDRVWLVFDRPWPGEQWMMFYWSAEDVNKLPKGDEWVSKVVGTSPSAGANNTIVLWIAGESAKMVETLPEEVVKRKLVELLQRFAGSDVTVPRPVTMLRSTWYSDPFARGSYSYENLQTPQRPGLRDALAAPLRAANGAPRVLFAGEATDARHYGTVVGAGDTGHREARRLLAPAAS